MEATNQYPAGPWWVVDLYNDGTVYLFMAEGDNYGGGIGRARSDGSLPVNTWTHVTIVVDRANFTTKYYFNGVLDSEKAVEADFDGDLSPSSFLSIGSVWNPFSGKIDELKIFRRALQPEEVLAEYQGTPGTSPGPGDPQTSTLTYDLDGNLTNDGTFQYEYDAENRLTSVTPITPTTGSTKVEFGYDYMSRRVEKKVYTYDGSSWVLEIDIHDLSVYL
jgi:hypothetical protein